MLEYLKNFDPVIQAFIASFFTWGLTALGSSIVFLTKEMNKKLLKSMLGFAGGVMISASFWSLLAPSIEMMKGKNFPWFPAIAGFLTGSIFLLIIDRILPHLHFGLETSEAEGIKTRWRRTTLLVLAITLHNIPEGLAIGVAFGAVASGASFYGAIALAIGIGIQNFPEGMAISMPLKGEGFSSLRSFWYGQLSALVEPIFAVIGAFATSIFKSILPYALAFAAGAMIFVVVEEIIPESQRGGNSDLATISAIIGFAVMMFLDVAFG
ncbi:MAG: ZIP family metal transporter [Thermoplasmatales archaeon]|nr:ZIP family metal transporter [Thermoplasmatales archaeon]